MNRSFKNEVKLIGQVVEKPEIGKFNDGRRYARFSMHTTSRDYNEQGKLLEQLHRHEVSFWQKPLVGLIEKRVFKGSRITLLGTLFPSFRIDAAGNEHFKTEIVGKRIIVEP